MFYSWNDRPTRKLAHADPKADGKDGRHHPRNVLTTRTPRPADEMPPEYWRALMDAAAADREPPDASIRAQRLSEIHRHLLRVACRRCGRTVEIQKADAVRLHGTEAVWKDVGQRLLDNTCQQRTGRHEEDGCWPSFE